MKALVSGQAGLAVVLGDPPEFRPVGAAPYHANEAEIGRVLAGFQDVEEVDLDDCDVDRLDTETAKAWARDRALYRLYMLFDDPEAAGSFERRIVDELDAFARAHDIGVALTDWLSEVELGPAHEERARTLAERYSRLRPYLRILYPGPVEEAVKQAQSDARFAATTEQLGREAFVVSVRHVVSPRGSRRLSTRLSRPDSPAERRARELLAPLLVVAAQRVGQLRAGRWKMGQHLALNKAVDRVIADLRLALQRAGIAEDVVPYRRAEIKALLRTNEGRPRITGRTSRTIAGSKRAWGSR